jgi:HEAT repeat protein
LRKIKQVSVENLIDCLNDKDIIIRRNAVKALREMGVKAQKAIPALILCLNDEKAEVRKNASFALAKIGEPNS